MEFPTPKATRSSEIMAPIPEGTDPAAVRRGSHGHRGRIVLRLMAALGVFLGTTFVGASRLSADTLLSTTTYASTTAGQSTSATFTAPAGTSYVIVKLWGAGGGEGVNEFGGAGGFVTAQYPLTAGQTVAVVVGGSGNGVETGGSPGGGSALGLGGAGGGGYSKASTSSWAVYAPGGGGGSNSGTAGGAGGANAANGAGAGGGGPGGGGGATSGSPGAAGGGTPYPGTAGGSLIGGSGGSNIGYVGGGGGGGIFGGGGGASSNGAASSAGGGGGGAAGVTGTAPTSITYGASSGSTPAGTGDPNYPNSSDGTTTTGYGGHTGVYTWGGNGAVVILAYQTPQPQTITFSNPGTQTYGEAAFALTATASSGLPVTLTVASGPATISGSTITLTGPGTVVVSANQGGNSAWSPATQVQQSFTVNPEAQNITFTNPGTQSYGVAPFALTASATSGLPVTFTVASGPASISGSTITITGPGAVVVDANQAGGGNWAAAAQVQQTFTVNPSPPTVTFSASATNIPVGGSVTFTGTATDANGVLYGDQFYRYNGTTYYQPNGSTNTRTWTWMTLDTGWSALSSPTDIPPNGFNDSRTATWTGSSSGSYAFYYAADDSAADWSTTLSVTVNVVAAPTSAVAFSANPITFGQSAGVIMTIVQGLPGSLTLHQMMWDGGVGQQWSGIGFAVNYPSNTTGMTAISDLTQNPTGANSSTKSFTFTPWAANAGGYQFLSWGLNNVGTFPVTTPVGLVVNKATPSASFPAATKTPQSGTTYTVGSADLDAAFANPWSSLVALPSGAVTYTISPASPNGTPGTAVIAGTTFSAGLSYVIRASLTADGNYNAATVDSTWTIAQAPQTITFPVPAAQVYGNPPFTVSGSSTSGLPVSFTIASGPATISGTTVTITGAGTIVIQASQGGNASWAAAPNVTQSVVVSQAPQTVTLTPLTVSLLTTQSATFTASGAQNGYTWSGTAGASGSGSSQTLAFPIAGSFTVTVQSPAGGNFAASLPVTATVTVTAAYTLTIVPDPGGTVSGGGLFAASSNPAISATANAGYVFAGWYGANASSVANPYSTSSTISLTGNMTVNARFASISGAPNLGTINFQQAVFPSSTYGTPHETTRDVTATNVGTGNLELRSLTVTSNAADFSASSNGGMIAPGGNISNPIVFSPSGSSLGTRTGTLVIVSTDATYPVAAYTLTGTAMDGTLPPTVTLSVTSLSLIFPGDSITLNMTASTPYDSIAYFTWYLVTPTGTTATTTVMGPSMTLTSNVPYLVPNLMSSIGAYSLSVTAVDTNGLSTTQTYNFSVVQGLYNRSLNLRAEPTGSLQLWFTTSSVNTDTIPVWEARH